MQWQGSGRAGKGAEEGTRVAQLEVFDPAPESVPREAGLGNSKLFRLILAVVAAASCIAALPAGAGGYTGRVVVELLDEIEYLHKFRLLEDFSFLDSHGKIWVARKGGIVDDESVPRELQILSGLPYVAEYRKAAVIHDYFCRTRSEPWKQVHRTLFDASVAEGVAEAQAKALYAVVYAGGWRWETRESGCYRSCHAASESLAWRPAATATEIEPILQWIRQDAPDLDDIDRRVDAVVRKPGPHLFAQRP
jgi:hypothetical protein